MAIVISGNKIKSTSPRSTVQSKMSAVRAQAAVVRSLLDDLDELTPASGSPRLAEAFATQTIEELVQLAHKMMDLAVAAMPQVKGELYTGDSATSQ